MPNRPWGALHAPGSSSALWRTGLMLQSSWGQGMGQLAAQNLEKKIPLMTSRSSRESSVIGLEVGQVDQGKRVLVQYIYYNLIISVFNNWCIRKIYRFIRFSACFDAHSVVCILWQGACPMPSNGGQPQLDFPRGTAGGPWEEDPLGDQQEQPRELRHRHRPRSWASRPRQESDSAVHFL